VVRKCSLRQREEVHYLGRALARLAKFQWVLGLQNNIRELNQQRRTAAIVIMALHFSCIQEPPAVIFFYYCYLIRRQTRCSKIAFYIFEILEIFSD